MLEVRFLLHRLLPTLCPETISHFYVGLRPPARLPPAAAAAAGAVFPAANTVYSVPWLFSAMPLPQPVAGLDVPGSSDGAETSGDSDASTEDLDCASGRSADHSPENRRSPLSPSAGDVVGVGGQHRVEAAEGAAVATGEKGNAINDGDVSLRFVCQVEVARLLATTAMGVLGDGGGGGGSGEAEEGREECARVLEAAEAFFSTFERTYSG